MIITLFNAMISPMLLNLDNSAMPTGPSQKMEQNGNAEQNRRYLVTWTLMYLLLTHMIVKNKINYSKFTKHS